jgi:hypothetical protein
MDVPEEKNHPELIWDLFVPHRDSSPGLDPGSQATVEIPETSSG